MYFLTLLQIPQISFMGSKGIPNILAGHFAPGINWNSHHDPDKEKKKKKQSFLKNDIYVYVYICKNTYIFIKQHVVNCISDEENGIKCKEYLVP